MRSEEQDTRFRLGLIGGGEVARSHAVAILALSDLVRHEGCSDILPERADVFAEQSSTQSTPLIELLNRVDGVIIATPPATHEETAIAAFEHGLPVLCEKELAPTVEACDRMLTAAAQHGICFSIGYRFRHDPHFSLIKGLIERGAVGVPTILSFRLPRSIEHVDQLTDMAFPGGVALGRRVHGVDILQYVLGEPDAGIGLGVRTIHAKNSSADDGGAMVFRFGSALVLVSVHWAGVIVRDREMLVEGTEGVLLGSYMDRYIKVDRLDGHNEYLSVPPLNYCVGGISACLDFVRQIQNFVLSAQGVEDLLAPATIGRQTVALISEIQSARTWMN